MRTTAWGLDLVRYTCITLARRGCTTQTPTKASGGYVLFARRSSGRGWTARTRQLQQKDLHERNPAVWIECWGLCHHWVWFCQRIRVLDEIAKLNCCSRLVKNILFLNQKLCFISEQQQKRGEKHNMHNNEYKIILIIVDKLNFTVTFRLCFKI